MNRINRKVEYALMALKFMSGRYAGELTTAKEVCEKTGSPFDATARVMQVLAQKGVLKSEQGAKGGYLLVKDLSKVSFYDLVEIILGPMAVVKCIGREAPCCDFDALCNIKAPLFDLNDRLTSFYKGITLKELLSAKPLRDTVDAPENVTALES